MALARRTALVALSGLVGLLGLSAARSVARAEPPDEGVVLKGHAFAPSLIADGKRFVLLGAGVRRKLIVDVYAMGFYVEEERARHAFPALAAKAKGREREKLLADGRAQSFVIWGAFAKRGVLHFLSGVDAGAIRGAFEEGLEPILAESMPAELRDRARAFIALFDRDMKEGEELVLVTLPSGAIEVSVAGVKKDAPVDARLGRAIWEMWIGTKPALPDLRRTLVERIDLLGK